MNDVIDIKKIISNSISLKQKILQDELLLSTLKEICKKITQAFQEGKKVLLCGNGGSAADAQHIAAELSGRFYLEREPLFAEALHVNTSYLTAIANDYSFDKVFSRLVQAKGREGDVLIAISTSGNSPNVLEAVEVANAQKMLTIGVTGGTGGKLAKICQYVLIVPDKDTARIQEAHIMLGHVICEWVEKAIFAKF